MNIGHAIHMMVETGIMITGFAQGVHRGDAPRMTEAHPRVAVRA